MIEERKISLGNEIIKVKIIRKNNKNIYFRFDEESNLIVTSNKKISTSKIIKLIEDNESSLIRLLNKNKNKQDKDGEIKILGLKYNIKEDPNISKITFNNGNIYINNSKYLEKYISNLTRQVFNEEINKILKIMPNIPKFTLKIRKMKTRWGVCNYVKKIITLNSKLIKYDRNIIDYVIIHELSHFTYHNHSSNFWELVATYFPNYKKARKELRGE